jgi:hypothetical protein
VCVCVVGSHIIHSDRGRSSEIRFRAVTKKRTSKPSVPFRFSICLFPMRREIRDDGSLYEDDDSHSSTLQSSHLYHTYSGCLHYYVYNGSLNDLIRKAAAMKSCIIITTKRLKHINHFKMCFFKFNVIITKNI